MRANNKEAVGVIVTFNPSIHPSIHPFIHPSRRRPASNKLVKATSREEKKKKSQNLAADIAPLSRVASLHVATQHCPGKKDNFALGEDLISPPQRRALQTCFGAGCNQFRFIRLLLTPPVLFTRIVVCIYRHTVDEPKHISAVL